MIKIKYLYIQQWDKDKQKWKNVECFNEFDRWEAERAYEVWRGAVKSKIRLIEVKVKAKGPVVIWDSPDR